MNCEMSKTDEASETGANSPKTRKQHVFVEFFVFGEFGSRSRDGYLRIAQIDGH